MKSKQSDNRGGRKADKRPFAKRPEGNTTPLIARKKILGRGLGRLRG